MYFLIVRILSVMLVVLISLVSCLDRERDNVADPYSTSYMPKITSELHTTNALSVYSEKNELIWLKPFEVSILQVDFIDIDMDGYNEVIVGFSEQAEGTGVVLAFNTAGDTVLHLPSPTSIYPHTESAGLFGVRHLKVDDLDGDGENEIVVCRNNTNFHQTELSVWSSKPSDTSESYEPEKMAYYWHPGHVNHISINDLDQDGDKEIVIDGHTNDMTGYVNAVSVALSDPELEDAETPMFLAVLDYPFTSGEGPPWLARTGVNAEEIFT